VLAAAASDPNRAGSELKAGFLIRKLCETVNSSKILRAGMGFLMEFKAK